MQENNFGKQWRANFVAGLFIVMPAVISIGVVVWLFQNASDAAGKLFVFLPPTWWRVWAALALTILLICFIGRYGRSYFGRKAIEWFDHTLLRVPLVNKIYGTVKQVNESFSNNKSSFKQVVLVTFPHGRSRSVGFVTGEQKGVGMEKLISVFIPTTPNPTSGFLILVPESEIIRLDMSVGDGIKFIISLGAIAPDHAGRQLEPLLPRPAAPPPQPMAAIK